MYAHAPDVLEVLLFAAPLLAVAVILVYFCLLRVRWRFYQRFTKSKRVFRPSTVALGLAFQFLQAIYRPSVANVVEIRQLEDAEEDEEGDPKSLLQHLGPQLRRIRRGEQVERITLRR